MNNPVAWCLTYFFNKFLQDRIGSLSSEQLVTELFNGKLELKNIVLNSNLLGFENSGFKLTRGLVQSFQLLIPWTKVLLGEPCLVKINVKGIFLELDYSLEQLHENPVDPEELKAKVLAEFEEFMNQKKRSFYKILNLLPGKNYFSLEVVEYLISRLQIRLSNIQISIGQQEIFRNSRFGNQLNLNHEYYVSIGDFSIIPTDDLFEPVYDDEGSV